MEVNLNSDMIDLLKILLKRSDYFFHEERLVKAASELSTILNTNHGSSDGSL